MMVLRQYQLWRDEEEDRDGSSEDSAPDTPVEEAEAPADETEAPIEETDAPVVEADAPAAEPDAPVVEADAPVVEADAPVVEADAPVVEADAPVVEADAPVAEPENPVAEPDAPVDQLDHPEEIAALVGGADHPSADDGSGPADLSPSLPPTIEITVSAGDNLSKLAEQHGTTVSEIVRANPELADNPNFIAVGQNLNIPENSIFDRSNDANKPDAQLMVEARARGEATVTRHDGSVLSTVTAQELAIASGVSRQEFERVAAASGKGALTTVDDFNQFKAAESVARGDSVTSDVTFSDGSTGFQTTNSDGSKILLNGRGEIVMNQSAEGQVSLTEIGKDWSQGVFVGGGRGVVSPAPVNSPDFEKEQWNRAVESKKVEIVTRATQDAEVFNSSPNVAVDAFGNLQSGGQEAATQQSAAGNISVSAGLRGGKDGLLFGLSSQVSGVVDASAALIDGKSLTQAAEAYTAGTREAKQEKEAYQELAPSEFNAGKLVGGVTGALGTVGVGGVLGGGAAVASEAAVGGAEVLAASARAAEFGLGLAKSAGVGGAFGAVDAAGSIQDYKTTEEASIDVLKGAGVGAAMGAVLHTGLSAASEGAGALRRVFSEEGSEATPGVSEVLVADASGISKSGGTLRADGADRQSVDSIVGHSKVFSQDPGAESSVVDLARYKDQREILLKRIEKVASGKEMDMSPNLVENNFVYAFSKEDLSQTIANIKAVSEQPPNLEMGQRIYENAAKMNVEAITEKQNNQIATAVANANELGVSVRAMNESDAAKVGGNLKGVTGLYNNIEKEIVLNPGLDNETLGALAGTVRHESGHANLDLQQGLLNNGAATIQVPNKDAFKQIGMSQNSEVNPYIRNGAQGDEAGQKLTSATARLQDALKNISEFENAAPGSLEALQAQRDFIENISGNQTALAQSAALIAHKNEALNQVEAALANGVVPKATTTAKNGVRVFAVPDSPDGIPSHTGFKIADGTPLDAVPDKIAEIIQAERNYLVITGDTVAKQMSFVRDLTAIGKMPPPRK